MEPFVQFLYGCVIIALITLLANLLFKKRPQIADKVIDYVTLSLLVVLIGYAITQTVWEPIENKLSKELEEYRETQKNAWRLR